MPNPLDSLKDRLFSKKSKQSSLTNIMEMIREFGCFGDIIGREFEVRDNKNKIVYTVRQKPMALKQMNILLKELHILKMLDNEREAAKWGKK